MMLYWKSLVGVLGVAALGACTTVRQVQPVEYLANNAPEMVWVTDTNNTVVQVAEPEIKRDTLRGTVQGSRERVAIPLGDIRSVQAKLHDHTKTALLATTLGVGVVATMYFGFIANGSGGSTVDCTGDEVTKHPTEHPECFN